MDNFLNKYIPAGRQLASFTAVITLGIVPILSQCGDHLRNKLFNHAGLGFSNLPPIRHNTSQDALTPCGSRDSVSQLPWWESDGLQPVCLDPKSHHTPVSGKMWLFIPTAPDEG